MLYPVQCYLAFMKSSNILGVALMVVQKGDWGEVGQRAPLFLILSFYTGLTCLNLYFIINGGIVCPFLLCSVEKSNSAAPPHLSIGICCSLRIGAHLVETCAKKI